MTPSSRSAGTGRGRPRPGASGLIRVSVFVLALAQAVGAKAPPCVDGCDTCLDTPCSDFDDCRTHVSTDVYDVCLEKCIPPGKFPSFEQGRCTIIRECVDKCRRQRGVNQQNCRSQLRRDVKKACNPTDAKCQISIRASRNLCRDCGLLGAAAAAAVVPLAATGSACQSACISRNAGDCFNTCRKECRGDQDATRLCGEGCGDARCATLQTKCTVPDDPTDTKELSKRDSQYLACCGPGLAACEGDDIDSVGCEVTTTSTTIPTTTSTTSTTTRTTSTSSTTLITGMLRRR